MTITSTVQSFVHIMSGAGGVLPVVFNGLTAVFAVCLAIAGGLFVARVGSGWLRRSFYEAAISPDTATRIRQMEALTADIDGYAVSMRDRDTIGGVDLGASLSASTETPTEAPYWVRKANAQAADLNKLADNWGR